MLSILLLPALPLCFCLLFVFDAIRACDIMGPQLGINQSSNEHITPASVVGLIDGFKSMALGDVRSLGVCRS
jgi:hypothetical protein